MRFLCTVILIMAALPGAFASDGVFEINQACASGPGCFPGDEPGFPVRLINSGSYKLTSNLTVPPLVNGITTQIDNATLPADISVSIDLNGFRISSTTVCSVNPFTCSPLGSNFSEGIGIYLATTVGDTPAQGAALVHNGVVQGMGLVGVYCTGQCVIRDLVVSNNGFTGLVSEGSIHRVQAFRNGGAGIYISNHGSVENCSSVGNGAEGFSGGGSGSLSNNNASDNGSHGIQGFVGATVIGNTVERSGTGIRCIACTITNNSLIDNEVAGIDFVDSPSIYGGNIITGLGSNNALVNATKAVQSDPNICGQSACP